MNNQLGNPMMLNGVAVFENENCMQNYQLTKFTKELMGPEWVKQFDEWAAHALPREPACYMVGGHKLIIHPTLLVELRKINDLS